MTTAVSNSDNLFAACESGDLEKVKQLLSQGADINARKKDQTTPLMVACQYGRFSVAKHLIEKGSNIEDKDMSGGTILMIACFGGSLPLVKYLIEERNADVTERDEDGITCLLDACYSGSLEVLRYLVEEKQVDMDETENNGRNGLMQACIYGNVPVVRYLIEQRHVDSAQKDAGGDTCLTLACKHGLLPVVKYLIIEQFMKPPASSELYKENVNKFLRKCKSKFLNEQRHGKLNEIKDFMHQHHLKQVWDELQDEEFFQSISTAVYHAYQLILSDPDRFSDLKVCFEASEKSTESNGENNLVTVYAQKKRLRESCTFMRNLLSDAFNDVPGSSEENNMQTVKLSQELLQECPSDWLKQLLIYLAWSKKGDQLHHHANTPYSDTLLFSDCVDVFKYSRTCNALGLEVDVSAWIQLIEKFLEKFNRELIESTLKSGKVGEQEHVCIQEIYGIDEEIFDLCTQVLEENDVLYFFLLVNAAPATLETPETIATKCREWLLSPKASGKYAETLKNQFFISALHSHLGFDFTTGKVYIPVDEEFVKRKKRRLE